jgi:hypothetical protein
MSVLKGSKNFYSYEASDTLAYNLKNWLEYGLVEMGAYTPVKFSLATSGYTNLKNVYDERYGGSNRVYEGLGPSWVWESGISPIGTSINPFQVSGVYVNNTFYPSSTTSGSYAHTVDYERGRIIFASGVSATVKCEYTFRDISVYLSDTPQWKEIITQYLDKYDTLDTSSPSGMASVLKENRVWLPCVVIEVQDRTNSALQLGGGEINTYAVFYHVFSDNAFSAKRLIDTINNQYEKTLTLFDINSAPFPLSYEGSISSGALTYPEVSSRSSPYFWTYGAIISSRGGSMGNLSDVYTGTVVQSIEVARYLSTY